MQVTVVSTFATDRNDVLANSLRDSGIDVKLVGPTRGRLARHPQLRSRVTELVRRSDVIHIHALWEEIQHQAATTARESSIPYIIRPCGMLDPWSLSQRRVLKWLYLKLRMKRNLNGAYAIHYTTRTESRLAEPLRLTPPSIVVPNGVEAPSLASIRTDITRSSLRIPDSAFILAHFGRLHPKKGIEVSIRALTHFTDLPHQPYLLVIGPGDAAYVNELKDLARRHHVHEFIRFLGMQDGPGKYAVLRLANLFALPSYQENFGISVIDAMAAEVPVAISDQVNLCDDVEAAGAGAVFPLYPVATAPERLSGIIHEFQNNPAKAAASGRAGRVYVQKHYAWQSIAEQWAQHYQQAVDLQKRVMRHEDRCGWNATGIS
jgi:glycosyltransferase involved in cell wall biosynthesis